MPDALFDYAPAPEWAGSKALVPLPADACPACGGPVLVTTISEPPLFRHGGYGAVRQSVTRICERALRPGHDPALSPEQNPPEWTDEPVPDASCRWGLTVDVTEVSPRGLVSSA